MGVSYGGIFRDMFICRLQLFAEREPLDSYMQAARLIDGRSSALPEDHPDDFEHVDGAHESSTRPSVYFNAPQAPLGWLEELSDQWPDIEFRLLWHDHLMAGVARVQAGVTQLRTASKPTSRQALLLEYGASDDSSSFNPPTPEHHPGGPYENTQASGEDSANNTQAPDEASEDNTQAAREWTRDMNGGDR